MARIRTVKPSLFRHVDLFALEQESGLPLRLAYIGLWTAADREGRFKWIPRELKLDCLPYDDVDFSRVLDALATRQYLLRYPSNSGEFGFIPTFREHQFVNPREAISKLPEPFDVIGNYDAWRTREPRVPDAPISYTPIINYSTTPTRRRVKPSLEGFDAFYKAYPKKRKRGDAERAWSQTAEIRPALETLLAAIDKHKATDDWRVEAGKFIPHPASWLRSKGWEDSTEVDIVPLKKPEGFIERKLRELREADAAQSGGNIAPVAEPEIDIPF